MKRFLLSLSALVFTLVSQAQISAGYYRVQNANSQRYMALLDRHGSVRTNGGAIDADLYAFRTLVDSGVNKISSNPATVVYIANATKGYSISAQGVSSEDILNNSSSTTNATLYIDQIRNSSYYYISAEAQGIAQARLRDVTRQKGYEDIADSGTVRTVATSQSSNVRASYWTFTPVRSNTSCYFGFTPTIQSNGKYYQTFYAGFPFRVVSSGVKVYYISNIHWRYAAYRPFEDGAIIPAGTPVIVECSSPNAADNQIELVTQDGTAISDNYLRGVYFNYYFDEQGETKKHDNRTAFNPSTMRVLRVKSDGTLAFVNNPSEASNGTYYLPANEAYLQVSSDTPAELSLVSYDDPTGIQGVKVSNENSKDEPTYTINGVRVEDSNNLPHGIYIKGRKKVVK